MAEFGIGVRARRGTNAFTAIEQGRDKADEREPKWSEIALAAGRWLTVALAAIVVVLVVLEGVDLLLGS